MVDDSTRDSDDRSDSGRRKGSGKSRRNSDDPEMKKMFDEFGFEDERKGSRRTAADRRDEENMQEFVMNSDKSPGYIK